MLTEHERYLFDVRGYLVLEDVLGPDEISEINALVDSYDLWSQASWRNDPNFCSSGRPHVLDEPVRRLIAHPRIVPYLLELCGPKVRYDHGHFLLNRKGAKQLSLHGGSTPWDPAQYYLVRNGTIHNGLVAIAISLVDASAEDGGFACIPGSHKANFPCPPEFRDFEDTSAIVHVPVRAGSAILFTEALTHGTWPWQSDRERRGIFLKYTPGNNLYEGPDYPTPEPGLEYSELERRLLTPPYVWERPDTIPEEADEAVPATT